MKIKKIQSFLKTEKDAVIIFSEINRFYFTGFSSSDGFFIITKNDCAFFTDSRYTEAAEKAIKICPVILYTGIEKSVIPYLKEKNINNIYTECENLTVSQFEAFKKFFDFCTVTASSELEKIIGSLRSVKEEFEISRITEAQRIAEKAFTHILGFIKPGITEKDIALELDFFMLKNGADGLSFETIAVSGKNSSMPHGVPSEKRIENGDFITMDFGAVIKGYHSDMTRTVAVGKVTDEQRFVYNTVLEAQKKALSVLNPGVLCRDADKAARDIIDNAGYKNRFGHSTGHGVGAEIHELPNLSPKSEKILENGNIVTVEPGIYLPGKFGVRIEDMALITENGFENLTKAPKELIVL